MSSIAPSGAAAATADDACEDDAATALRGGAETSNGPLAVVRSGVGIADRGQIASRGRILERATEMDDPGVFKAGYSRLLTSQRKIKDLN